MSSFFNRQPEMFDPKKRLGMVSSSSSQDQKNNFDEGENLQESWVELAPSRASLCSSVEAAMLFEGSGGDTGTENKGSRLSPVSLGSHVEFDSLEQVKDRLNELLPRGTKNNTDWIWDWSHESLIQRNTNQSGQVGSTLTTPPNSPVPESLLDLRRQKKSKGFWRFGIILGFVMSNCVFLLIGATLGYYMCKKMNKAEPTPLVWRDYW